MFPKYLEKVQYLSRRNWKNNWKSGVINMKATRRVNPGALSPMKWIICHLWWEWWIVFKNRKGKKKNILNFDKNDKKLLVRFINEAKAIMIASNSQYAGVYNFLTYITDIASKKESTLK